MAKYELNPLPRGGILQNNSIFLMWIVHIVLLKRLRSDLYGKLQTIAISVLRERHTSRDNVKLTVKITKKWWVTSNYYYLLSAYVFFAVFAIVTWYFVRKSASDSFIRKAMGKQFFSAATWFVIADVGLSIFMPDSIDWAMNIGILGIAILCYVVGVLILNSYHENDEEYFENISEHTIAIYFSKCDNNYCAKVSDNVPGTLVFTADSFTELLEEAPKSLRFHIEGMLKDGADVPEWLANDAYDIEFVFEKFTVPSKITIRNIEEN